MRFSASRFLLPALSALFTSCSSIEYDAASAPRMLVSEDKTPFFKHGPAQGNGPDRTLQAGEDVTVMCRESGYSRVQLPTGEIGYVANEALVAAPPPLKATNVPVGNVPSFPDQQPSFRY